MMNRISLFLVLALIVFQAGCANLSIRLPNPSVEVPELAGASSQWNFQLASYSAHEYTSTANAAAQPPDFDNPMLGESGNFTAGVGYEFLSQFRFSLDVDPGQMMPIFKAQWQWLGPGRIEAKAGDWSSSVGFQASRGQTSKSAERQEFLGSETPGWNGRIVGSQLAVMSSFGYRPTDAFLLFLGAAFGNLTVSSTIDQDRPAGGSSGSSVRYEADDRGRATTFGLGGLIGQRVIGMVKFETTSIEYDRVREKEQINQVLFGLLF